MDTNDRGDTVMQLTAQILLYARDLKAIADNERRRSVELAAANERLRLLDRLKMDFLSFVSHELRSPLTAMALVELLEGEELGGTAAEIVSVVKGGYDRLHRFVTRAIQYFDSLAGEGDWATDQADICDIVRQRLDALHGVTLDVELPEYSCLVRGNPRPLAEVVDILLDNVVKHAAGEPRAVVRVSRGTDVALSVRDHGKGFDPEMAPEITRAFTPADIMHHSEGSVVSLALAAHLTQQCGGTLAAHSDGPGKGATFVVTLRSPEPPTIQPLG